MWTKTKVAAVSRRGFGLALPCLIFGMLFCLPAISQEQNSPPSKQTEVEQIRDLQELVELAENQTAIKQAKVKISETEVQIAEAKLKGLKLKANLAEEMVAIEKAKFEELQKLKTLGIQNLTAIKEAEARLAVAINQFREFEPKTEEVKLEIKLKKIQHELAVLELQESKIRLKYLKERLKSNQK